ncbi:hypothetical protein AHAS_Ahas20G0132400 [Arachis hypogaea]
MDHACWVRGKAGRNRPSAGLPNRVCFDPVLPLTRQDHILLVHDPLKTAPPRFGHEHDGTRHEGELDSGSPEAETRGKSDEPTRQGRRKDTAGSEHGRLNEAERETRNRGEEGCGQCRETAEGAPELAADGTQQGSTCELEVIIDERERELLRKETALRTELRHGQRTPCNSDVLERTRIPGDTSQGRVVGIITNCNEPEADRQSRGKYGLGLEEKETVLDGLAQNGNGQEDERDNSAESGPEMRDCLNDGTKTGPEDQRPSWEEEMAENKEAWKLAVESGAQCSDEEDIMAILQE